MSLCCDIAGVSVALCRSFALWPWRGLYAKSDAPMPLHGAQCTELPRSLDCTLQGSGSMESLLSDLCPGLSSGGIYIHSGMHGTRALDFQSVSMAQAIVRPGSWVAKTLVSKRIGFLRRMLLRSAAQRAFQAMRQENPAQLDELEAFFGDPDFPAHMPGWVIVRNAFHRTCSSQS